MASSRKQIFLSYTGADREWAETIAKGLSDRGLNVFYDAWEVLPGDNWALRVGRALENSQAMIVLLSPEAVDSLEVRSQISYAVASSRFEHSLVSVEVKKSPVVPWILRQKHFFRATTPEETVRKIMAALPRFEPATRQTVS